MDSALPRVPLSRTRKRPISCLQTLLTGRRLSLKEEKSLSWARWRRKNEKYTTVEIPDPKRDVQRTPCAFSKQKKSQDIGGSGTKKVEREIHL